MKKIIEILKEFEDGGAIGFIGLMFIMFLAALIFCWAKSGFSIP